MEVVQTIQILQKLRSGYSPSFSKAEEVFVESIFSDKHYK